MSGAFAVVATPDGQLPDGAALRERVAREGIDAATRWLYERVNASPLHGPFIRRIGELMALPPPPADGHRAAVAIVPAAFYRDGAKSGADGRLIAEESHRLGWACDRIPIARTGTVWENARVIGEFLRQRPGRPLILASLSKGGSDVKVALARPEAAEAFAAVGAWLNLCGTLGGTPLANWLLSNHPAARLSRLLYRVTGESLSFLSDLRYGAGQPMDFPLQLPAHVQLINVVGFPLREHLRHGITRRSHRRMSALGPNDASLVLSDVCAQPGLLYPVWGADHFLQPNMDVRRLIGALLQYIEESWTAAAG